MEITAIDAPGIYEIKDGDQIFGRFAVNFQDSVESDLRNLSPGRREPALTKETPQAVLDKSYSWVIMLGLFVILRGQRPDAADAERRTMALIDRIEKLGGA